MPVFADLVLPLAVPGLFTYEVPAALESRVCAGIRAVVPFGTGRKMYGGVIARVHTTPPLHRSPRQLMALLDGTPVVLPEQVQLWERIAEHYLCPIGSVMLAALPAPLVLTSETRVVAGSHGAQQWTGVDRHDALIEALDRQQELSIAEAGALLGLKDPMPAIKRLMDQGALLLAEEIGSTFKPRMQRFVRMAAAASSEEALQGWFDRLAKAPRQLGLLMRMIELGRVLSDAPREVERGLLLRSSGAGAADLRKLVEKGVLDVCERPAGAPPPDAGGNAPRALSPAQATALSEVRAGFAEHGVVLLQGVTSSGKTELYMELIAATMAAGGQCLYLLPEIALTTQVIARLRARFGERVSVFHSRLSTQERTELWMNMLRDPQAHPLIVGARSSLFLPFHGLGLVIVDEEHDPSYKQHEPDPRYHARDMAVVLAGLHKARVLLGSATPSMESGFNGRTGKYGLVHLRERHGAARLPQILCVDIGDEQRRKRMRGNFSSVLVAGIEHALARKEQVIVFQNRRGYVPVWQCEICGWVPECDHCDVSLTYHKQQHGLRCHYCGREYTPPVRCAACGSDRLRMLGFGTEKIEEELADIFPNASVARMDQDTTRGRHAFERILSRFGDGAVDVLVGTQMVTKGLDFEQVTAVGIINADQLLRFPDLRAHERAFQLMSQVAGRSGRSKDPGTVFIQAKDVHHPVIGLVMAHDVDGMYDRELEHRRAHGYPPFTRLVRLTTKHRQEDRSERTANVLAEALRTRLGERVLGPEPPPVARIRDKHLRGILLKLDRGAYRFEKEFLRTVIDQVFADPAHRAVQLVVDVDPL